MFYLLLIIVSEVFLLCYPFCCFILYLILDALMPIFNILHNDSI